MRLAICTCVLFILFSLTATKGICQLHFEDISLDSALKQAKQQNKFVFVDCYTTWCQPCKVMENEVFSHPDLTSLNTKFVSIRVDMEKGRGIDLREKFNINVFPGLVFLNAEGVVIDKISEGLGKEQFLKFTQNVSSGNTRFLALTEAYNKGERTLAQLSAYADLLKIARDVKYLKVADEWFSLLSEAQKKDDYGFDIVKNYLTGTGSSIKLKAYQYLQANKQFYAEKYSRDSVNYIIEQVLRKGLQYSISKKDTTTFLETLAEAYRQDFEGAKKTAVRWELSYYQKKDTANYLRLAKMMSDTYLKNEPDDLLGIAWVILELMPSRENLVFAKGLIDRSIRINNKDLMAYEISAKILVAQSKLGEAVSFLKTSIDDLKKQGTETGRIERLLTKLQQAAN